VTEKDESIRPYLSLVIPAYNEEERIRACLEQVGRYLGSLGVTHEIILVDDGSYDRTVEIAREFEAQLPTLRVISYETNAGKGHAVRQGVLASTGNFVAFSDTDLSAPIEELGKLFAAVEEGAQVAVGSRAIKGAKLGRHQPLYRELGGKALNLIIRMLAVRGIKDTQCGFKLFTGEAARRIFPVCFLNGWAFDVEALYLARLLGYAISEVPVRWNHSEGSKISPFAAGAGFVIDLLRMKLHNYRLGEAQV